jgi:signal transduction histidine kinase
LLEFRLRMHMVGRIIRWMVIALAMGTVWFGVPLQRVNLLAVYTMLVLASVYNFVLYFVSWRRLEEEGKAHWITIPTIIADCFCISVVVYVTGKIDSNFFVTYLLLVVWMAIHPGLRLRPWLAAFVVVSYSVAVFWHTMPTREVVFSFLMRSVIFGFVAWLSSRIARELRAVTAKLENSVRDLTDGLVVLDRDRRVILMNPRAAEMLGVNEAEALGQAVVDDPQITPAESLRKLTASPDVRSVSVLKRPVRVHEVALGAPERAIRVYTAEYVDETDRWAGELKVLHDVTSLKQLERLRAEVMSDDTHDLRNPLESVRGILALLRRRLSPDSEGLGWLGRAESEIDRLMRLTSEMLDSARMEAGKLQLRVQPLSLEREIGKVVGTVTQRAHSSGLELTAEVNPDLPPVLADSDRLTRIIHNLVDNALKFTPPGGAVRITGGLCPEDSQLAQVDVTDTGPGIEADKLETIFGRFEQIGDELWHKGAGLGLPICRDMVAAHGGHLWVESELGRGSSFRFTLPLATEGEPASPAAQAC